MPGYAPKAILPSLSPAITEADVRAATTSYEASYIIQSLVDLSSYLVDLVKHTTIFGPTINDPYSPSLKTLHDRLHAGHVPLNPLPAISKDATRQHQSVNTRTRSPIESRPLEDFEDMYYALLSRMQSMHQMLDARLSSGFNAPTDALFDGGPRIVDFAASLAEYWTLLNSTGVVRALDDAVRQARVNALYTAIHAELEVDVITQVDADGLLRDLYESKDEAEGLSWIGVWSPAMMGAWLEEKYRVVLGVEREEKEKREREMRKRAKMKRVKGKEGKVGRKGSRSPTKRSSIEKMLEGMEGGLARLKDTGGGGGGGGGVMSRGPGRRARFVQQVEEGMRMQAREVNKEAHIGVELENHDKQQRDFEEGFKQPDRQWQLKSQRVSEYSSYLRGAASYNARSIVDNTAYSNSVRGSMVGSLGLEDTMEDDADKMEF